MATTTSHSSTERWRSPSSRPKSEGTSASEECNCMKTNRSRWILLSYLPIFSFTEVWKQMARAVKSEVGEVIIRVVVVPNEESSKRQSALPPLDIQSESVEVASRSDRHLLFSSSFSYFTCCSCCLLFICGHCLRQWRQVAPSKPINYT